MTIIKLFTLIAFMARLGAGCASVQATENKADAKPYPLTKCLVSGEKLGGAMGKPYVIVQSGREIKFCCKNCVKEFNRDTAAFLKRLDAAEKEAAKAHPYPINTCVVSGEKLGGEMGEPYVFVYDDHEIKLCCKSCLKDFKKNSAVYLKKLDQAAKK